MANKPKENLSGRFGPRYGKKARSKLSQVESLQRKKQRCPYCFKHSLKRLSKGVWTCKACSKKFADDVYYLT